MMGVLKILLRRDLHEPAFNLERRLAGAEPSSVGDAEDMGVDGYGRLAESGVEDDIGGLAPDAGEDFKRFAGLRYAALMALDQEPGHGDDVSRLGPPQADGPYEGADLFLAERDHARRRVGDGEQWPCRLVDTDIGRLRGKDHGDEQRIGIAIMQFGPRRGIVGGEAPEELGCLFFSEARRHRALCVQGPLTLRQGERKAGAQTIGGSLAHRYGRAMVSASPYETLAPDVTGRAGELPPEARADDAFEAALYPNRSLPNAGFIAVMAVVIGVNLTLGTAFLLAGAWPVLGFCGLDIFLVWLAFKLSYRQGRLCERVRLTADELLVSRVLPSGHESRWRLQPFWTRVAIDRPVRHESQVLLVSKGGALVLGSFLSPAERGHFAEALLRALARLKRA